MGCSSWFLLVCITWTFFIKVTHQLQYSQTLVLLQLRKHLEYPKELEIWRNHTTDLCYLSSPPQLNITCEDNSVTDLRIMGDKLSRISYFDGYAIPKQTLSQNFSIDSFITTVARLTSLRSLSVVSLGMWGPLPDKIHRLSSLQFLDLSLNFLFGSIPPKISAMVNLQTLKLDSNFFNGTIPDGLHSLSNLTVLSLTHNRLGGQLKGLGSLTSLQMLDLRDNKLNSQLPNLPKGLLMASLSHNSFSGEIPMVYTQLHQLQTLDLSFNVLRGTPPAALFSLQNISYVNLTSNMLSGSLLNHLSCGSKLKFVDISNNKLTGGLPSCLNTKLDVITVKFGGNCLSVDLLHQRAESFCTEVHKQKKQSRGKSVGILIGVIGGLFIVIVLLAFGFLMISTKYCSRGIQEQHLLHKAVQDNSATGFSSEILTNARFISQAAKLVTQGVPMCRLFSLEELKEATNNFDTCASVGEGSHGKLYKGKLENGTQVAIRCLSLANKFSIRNLKLRLDLLWKLRHPHLVCLLGHCIEGGGLNDFNVNKVFLVYEYVPNGNFRTHLSEKSPEKVLKWPERLAVLVGVAKAVHFLHTGIIPGFFKNRLKTNNILLNEHRMAKLSDYGFSIITEEIDRHEAKEGCGHHSWQMTNLEDDVYSFGFILLEALVGPSVAARREAFLLHEKASFDSEDGRKRNIDPVVLASSSQESLSIVITIMDKCINHDSSTRPSFEDVLWNLQYAAQIQATTDGDRRS